MFKRLFIWKCSGPTEIKLIEEMDLSVVHKSQGEAMGIKSIFTNDYKSHLYSSNETFEQTDVKGNNNLFNPLKTETINDLGHSPSSLFQDFAHENKNNFELKNTVFHYSMFKKAVDLSIHNRTNDIKKKTIFEDADYFAKNYCYKLLPITFENVDETIIHTEHNYCHFSLSSESDMEEDCSRTMDYSQVKEKNYKRRKAKLCETVSAKLNVVAVEEEYTANETLSIDEPLSKDIGSTRTESSNSINLEDHPLDLSAPVVQEKTDHCITEHQPSIVNNNNISSNSNSNIDQKEDGGEFDSDKENQKSNLRCIEVTITRPDEKVNYQPCDLFLNDIAKLVPRLIGKDCFEIDILDKTCDRYVDTEKHRLYYIISESTWRLFQSTNERVILTNDQSLGQPIQKIEKDERPTFLVFDQFSLAKCLADYCSEIGGCFEYTCVEEAKEELAELIEPKQINFEVFEEVEEKKKKTGVHSKNEKNVGFQEEPDMVNSFEHKSIVEKSCENLSNSPTSGVAKSGTVNNFCMQDKINGNFSNYEITHEEWDRHVSKENEAKVDSVEEVTEISSKESKLEEEHVTRIANEENETSNSKEENETSNSKEENETTNPKEENETTNSKEENEATNPIEENETSNSKEEGETSITKDNETSIAKDNETSIAKEENETNIAKYENESSNSKEENETSIAPEKEASIAPEKEAEKTQKESNSAVLNEATQSLENSVKVVDTAIAKESKENAELNSSVGTSLPTGKNLKVSETIIRKKNITKVKKKNIKVVKPKEEETNKKEAKKTIISKIKGVIKALNKKKLNTSTGNSVAENAAVVSEIRTRSKSMSESETHNDLKNSTSQKSSLQKVVRSGKKRKISEKASKPEETPKSRRISEISTPKKVKHSGIFSLSEAPKLRQTEVSAPEERPKKRRYSQVSTPEVKTSIPRITRSKKSFEGLKEKAEADIQAKKKKETNEVMKPNVRENSTRSKRGKILDKEENMEEGKRRKKKVDGVLNVELRSRTSSQCENSTPKRNDVTQEKKKMNKNGSKGRKR